MIGSQNYYASPFQKFTAVTLSDSVVQPSTFRALYVLTPGNLAVQLQRDAAPTTIPVTAGQLLTFSAKRIYATGTTATVVGLN